MSRAGRRVRFASEPIYYSAPGSPAGSPSPAFSIATLSSEASPRTPPAWLDIALLASAGGDVPAIAHPALVCDARTSPAIRYDVALSLATLHIDAAYPTFDTELLLERPATHPPLPALTLLTDLLPYRVPVHPASASAATSPVSAGAQSMAWGSPTSPTSTIFAYQATASTFVTLTDVLHTLHRFLRTPVAPSEYSAHPNATAVASAFHARLARIGDPATREEQRRRGVKRVDLLLGKTMFAGLRATHKPDVWVVDFREP